MYFKNKIFYVLLLFLLLIPDDAFAVTFHSVTGYPTEVIINGISNQDSRKYTNDYSGTSTYDAYCADQGTNFTASQNFSEVNIYKNEKHCSYTLDGRNNNAYCSKMVARVIQVAREQQSGAELKWRWAQMCVWAYLGHHSDGNFILRNNYAYGSTLSATHVSYWLFSGVISEAARRYRETDGQGVSIDDDVSDKIGLSIPDSTLYFVPNGNSCNGGGYYITKNFTIKNNLGEKRRFKISVNVNDNTTENPVYICESGTRVEECKQVTQNVELTASSEKKYYLKSASSKVWSGGIKLKVELMPYTVGRSVSGNIPDTAYFANGGNQNMIVYIDNGGNISAQVTVKGEKNATFNYVSLSHETCENHKNDNVGKFSSSNEEVRSSSCINKFIKAGGDKTLPDKDKYEVNFGDCACTLLELDNGNKVNVRLYENVSFRYGVLNPILAYPGGGIRFSKKGESVTTDYMSTLTWRYVDFKDGKPYYYNSSNMANNIVTDSIHKEINEKIQGFIIEKLALRFKTIDSNDSKVQRDVDILSELSTTVTTKSVDGFIYNIFTSKTPADGISMNNAWFGIDGIVSYNSNSGIYGGNNYYIPVNYSGLTFPFDISKINLSAIDHSKNIFNFLYEADCPIEVTTDPDNPDEPCKENCDPDNPPGNPPSDPRYFEKAIVYRSINLNNPFPRANQDTGDDIKENWKDWYTNPLFNSENNRRRLENTFNSLPIYDVSLDKADKFNAITYLNNSYSYSSWAGIDVGGISSFVTNPIYRISLEPSKDSYCSIGEFKSDCDK